MLAAPHSELSSQLREAVHRGRERMRERLEAGAGGVEACAELSDVYDGIIERLWRDAVADAGDAATHLSLVATGGWGRREVCPASDVDFLLLAPEGRADVARAVADRLLYPLWDAGIEVGHAVRDPTASARLARDDLATATALLDLRHVVGDRAVSDQLARATRAVIAPGGNANDFVARLAEEKHRRHERFGDSLYLLEPNLKQGIGALRDLSTSVWAARARWSIGELSELVTMGQLSSRQVVVLKEALDFLLMLRSLVQLYSDRRTDQLTFELQEAIAPSLYPDARAADGDVRPAVAPAVEALMRRYYLHARGVVQVADRILELARVPKRSRPRVVKLDPSFLTFNGKLALTDPDVFAERPAEMVRLFRVALDYGVPIYGHTKERIAEHLAEDPEVLVGDPEAARYFLDALVDIRDDRQPSLLEEMHQVGVVNAVMPEFAPCTCRVQHDLYHVYTVDQHQLYAVAMLKRLARGELADELPTATAAVATVTRPHTLFLGTLLHDVGKPLGKGHSEKGAKVAGVIAPRLGMDEDDVAMVEFLVRQHLTMAHLSQRRDLSDPDVIARFAGRVGSEEALVQLFLLTLCDTAMTAPGNLSTWKAQLLRELYVRTRDFLRGGELGSDEQAAAARRVRQRVVELLAPSQDPEEVGAETLGAAAPKGSDERARVEAFLGGVDERFFSSLSPRQIARFVRLAWERARTGSVVETEVAHYPLKGHSELAVVADDVPALLSAIAGALAANRVDVLGAVVGSRREDRAPGGYAAMDLFYVRDLVGEAIPVDDPRWERIRDDLAELLRGGRIDGDAVEALIARRRRKSSLERRVTPAVPTEVKVDNDASTEATVVEVFTRDRPGVLYAITRVLAEHGLDIHLSKVGTEGEKAADAFYVTTADQQKVTDPARLEALQRSLVEGLAALGEE